MRTEISLAKGLVVHESVLIRTRQLSRIVTGIFDDKLRPFGISSAQYILLALIHQIGPVTRAKIARLQHLDKSTLTRNLRATLLRGWVEEVRGSAGRRSRPIALTKAGNKLVLNVELAWAIAIAEEEARAFLQTNGTILPDPQTKVRKHLGKKQSTKGQMR